MKKHELVEYGKLLSDIKERVRSAQHRAILSANAEMILMYWDIGRMIAAKKDREGWGAKVIPRLAVDLKNELPEQKGFSPANLKRMVRFWNEYPALCSIGAQSVRQSAIEASGTVGNEISAPSVRQLSDRTAENPDEVLFLQLSWSLCQTKDRIIAEYSLRDIEKPIGVADYELTRALPEKLASSLPSIEAIEAELSQDLAEDES